MEYIGKGYNSSIKAFNTLENRFRAVHQDTYDYSKFKYFNNNTPATIICKIHGEFNQIPSDHLNGKGCPKCAKIQRANSKRKTKEQFIKECKEIHKNRYLFANCNYTSIKDKVTITCRIHGDFSITADCFHKGQNCPKCAHAKRKRSKTKSLKLFIDQANTVHNYYYDYSKTLYRNDRYPIKIICPEHGEYLQTPNAHLSGKSCSLCKKNVGGFKSGLPGIFYILKVIKNKTTCFKVGITNHTIDKRYHKEDLANTEIIEELYFNSGFMCRKLETKIKQLFKNNQYKGPDMLRDGNTELFTVNPKEYDSYRVELRAIELALNTSTSPTTFTQAAKLVDKIEKTI